MSPMSRSVIRRALLYAPSSSLRTLIRSLEIISDNITYDLEDSVTPTAKHTARNALTEHLSRLTSQSKPAGELAVRINAVSTLYAPQDLSAVAALPILDAIIVPKVDSASDLTYVPDALQHLAPQRHSSASSGRSGTGGHPITLIALIESARAVMNLREICAASPYLSGLVFAAEDFALDLSIKRTPSLSKFLFARSAIVTAARAAGLPSAIDLVCTSFRDEEGAARLEEESRAGRAMGFPN